MRTSSSGFVAPAGWVKNVQPPPDYKQRDRPVKATSEHFAVSPDMSRGAAFRHRPKNETQAPRNAMSTEAQITPVNGFPFPSRESAVENCISNTVDKSVNSIVTSGAVAGTVNLFMLSLLRNTRVLELRQGRP